MEKKQKENDRDMSLFPIKDFIESRKRFTIRMYSQAAVVFLLVVMAFIIYMLYTIIINFLSSL